MGKLNIFLYMWSSFATISFRCLWIEVSPWDPYSRYKSLSLIQCEFGPKFMRFIAKTVTKYIFKICISYCFKSSYLHISWTLDALWFLLCAFASPYPVARLVGLPQQIDPREKSGNFPMKNLTQVFWWNKLQFEIPDFLNPGKRPQDVAVSTDPTPRLPLSAAVAVPVVVPASQHTRSSVLV